MVTVYVWNYQGKNTAWGHASMKVNQVYISWWPSNPGHVPSKIHNDIYASHPIRGRSFSDDVNAERRQPDHAIHIRDLNEKAIVAWWQGLSLNVNGVELHGPLLPWHSLNFNCSSVVATGLKKGGGDQHASWMKSWNLVWTPNDVLKYAESIRTNINKSK